MKKYINRQQAGIILAESLKIYRDDPAAIVLALPRGGVPVAYEIAKALSLPLDVFIVRKLGVPGHEELAMGAIASGDTLIFNDEILQMLPISQIAIDEVIADEAKELARREKFYRGDKPFPNLQDKIVILVDDGIATGASMRAAVKAIYKQKPSKIIVAVPVAALSTCEEMVDLVDELICPLKPVDFYAVGLWFEDFSQTSDEEVIDLLAKANYQHT